MVVWVASLGVGLGLGLLIGGHAPTQLSIGVSMLGELCAVGAKALNTGLPFAPEKLSNGRPGSS
ncbi:hypothetical protein [Lentzea sp. E54]|uniref:hypothetical protein n=1 Tax=Lentzea xerophila TaxID=3435883 RepID=UPI003DA266B3